MACKLTNGEVGHLALLCQTHCLINPQAAPDIALDDAIFDAVNGKLGILRRRNLKAILKKRIKLFTYATTTARSLGLRAEWVTHGSRNATVLTSQESTWSATSRNIHRFTLLSPGEISTWRQMAWRLARVCMEAGIEAEAFDKAVDVVFKKRKFMRRR